MSLKICFDASLAPSTHFCVFTNCYVSAAVKLTLNPKYAQIVWVTFCASQMVTSFSGVDNCVHVQQVVLRCLIEVRKDSGVVEWQSAMKVDRLEI